MNGENMKILSQKLTMEYLHAHPSIMSKSTDQIEDIVREVASINEAFYKALQETAYHKVWDFFDKQYSPDHH